MRRFTLLMLVMAGLVASSVSATAAVTVRQFFAYDPALAGGSAIATCDLFGDGKPVVVTGAGPGIGPHVRVFTVDGQELGGFLAYDAGFLGGVHVACAKGLVWTAPKADLVRARPVALPLPPFGPRGVWRAVRPACARGARICTVRPLLGERRGAGGIRRRGRRHDLPRQARRVRHAHARGDRG